MHTAHSWILFCFILVFIHVLIFYVLIIFHVSQQTRVHADVSLAGRLRIESHNSLLKAFVGYLCQV